MTSVCTGAHVYARAGVLEEPTIEQPDDRFVDSGEVVTSAGVSAGIDMALNLAARLDSHERAESVRRYMQYETPVAV